LCFNHSRDLPKMQHFAKSMQDFPLGFFPVLDYHKSTDAPGKMKGEWL